MPDYLTADEIRALPEHAVIMWHGVHDQIAYQRRRDHWWGTRRGLDVTTDGVCGGIDTYGDRWTLAWTSEVES